MRVNWPWRVRTAHAHQQVEEAVQDRVRDTDPLIERALAATKEAIAHREHNHFREEIEAMMRRAR